MEVTPVIHKIPRYLSLLLVTLLLAACSTPAPRTPAAQQPSPSFGSTERVTPNVNPFTGDQPGAPLAEATNIWFVEIDSPSLAEGGRLSTLSNEFDSIRTAATSAGIDYEERYTFTQFVTGFSAKLDPNQLGQLSGLPGVKRVTPVGIIEAPVVTETVEPQLATAISMTGADFVQSELGFDGSGIRIGIIDTGILLDHPEFAGRIVTGFDFVGDFYDASSPDTDTPIPEPAPNTRPGGGDCNGHGTHVAGIAAAGGAEVTGVAPGAELGAYRVFGCEGSSHSDVILAAIERAFEDGMDIVNLSLGSNNGWSQDFGSIVLGRMLELGMIPVASAGNNGRSGVYTIGSPGAGLDVITVASYDNIFAQTEKAIITESGDEIGYRNLTSAPTAPTEGVTEEIVYVGQGCNADTYEADPTGQVALITRGACTFAEKYDRAFAEGAVGVIIENNAAGGFAGTLGEFRDNGFGISISGDAGGLIRDLIADGTAPTLTWTDETIAEENPTGDLISSFSSYGLAPDLTLKPDIGAPGGLINSTYIGNAVAGDADSGDAVYAVLSGTSMSSPYIAGAVALLLEARPELRPEQVRDVLQNNAEPKPWNLNAGIGFLDSVHRQGAGMLRIDNAILAQNFAVPAKLSVGESSQGTYRDTMYIYNNTDQSIVYSLDQINTTIATAGNSNAPGFLASGALVEYFELRQSSFFDPISEIEVPAGGAAAFQVRVTANPSLPDTAVYGGYLSFTPTFEEGAEPAEGALPILVPYSGFKGDYQALPSFTFPPFLASVDEEGAISVLPPGTQYTMQGDDTPVFVVGLAHAQDSLTAQFVPAGGSSSWIGAQPAFDFELARRNNPGTVSVFDVGDFDASILPDGQYVVRISTVKALGDPTNPNHTVTLDSPVFDISRSR